MSLSGNQGNIILKHRPFTVLMTPKMTRLLSLAEAIFQGPGDTVNSSEADSGEEEDCGIHAYLGESSCEHGALNKLATTVEIVETLVY